MKLEGSCHCQAVRFKIESKTPRPFMRCYCTICRKTGGGGGYAINIMGEAATLEIEGEENLSVYRAARPKWRDERSPPALLRSLWQRSLARRSTVGPMGMALCLSNRYSPSEGTGIREYHA